MNLNKVVFKFVSISFSILIALLVIVGLVKLGSFCYDFGYRVFTEAPVAAAPGNDVPVQITEDMSEYDIGMLLEESGLIRDGNLFLAQLKLSAYSGKLRAGDYTLNTSMEAKDMMVVMAAEPPEEAESQEEQDAGEDVEMGTEAESGTESEAGEEL